MVNKYTPPQEELEYRLGQDLPLFQGDIALAADITSKWFRDNVYDAGPQALRVTMDTPFGDDIVYLEGEYADPADRLGILTGGIDPVTNEFQALRIDDEGRLLVDAAVSIQNIDLTVDIDATDGDSIGLYGYENGDTNFVTPINVTSEGFFKVVQAGNEDMSVIYDEGTFSGGIEHTVVDFTVAPGAEFNMNRVSGTGRTDAIWRVKINGSTIESKRNNWSERNVNFIYSKGLPLNAGDTVSLTIEHAQLTSKPFSGTIYGEDQ